MADRKFDLGDYVTVAERVQKFYAGFPDGRIQASEPKVIALGDATFIQVRATVWREHGDAKPSIATAWEPFPGKTPYTRDSEAMNAETSAVGRAIAFIGIEVNRSLASRDEVRARQDAPDPGLEPVSQGTLAATLERAARDGYTLEEWADVVEQTTGRDDGRPLLAEWAALRDAWTAYKAQNPRQAPEIPSDPPTPATELQRGLSSESASSGGTAEVGSRSRKRGE